MVEHLSFCTFLFIEAIYRNEKSKHRLRFYAWIFCSIKDFYILFSVITLRFVQRGKHHIN